MSTTNETTGSNSLQFNPIAQGVYDQLIKGGGNVLSGYMNSPLSNPAYNLGAAQSQKGAQQAGANNMASLNQNMLTSGMSGQAGAGFKQAQMAQTGRANQAMSSQANVSNVLAALQRQMTAAGTGLSFSPQLTGSTSKQTQTQSGLGTWLPQLLSGIAGAGMGAMTGGMSAAMPFGSVGGQSDPALGKISSMPGFAGAPSGGLPGTLPGGYQSNGVPPWMSGMFGSQ